MIIVATDTETTDILKPDAEIIEVGMQFWEVDTTTFDADLLKQKVWRIKPTGNIKAGAQRVHGISLEDLKYEPSGEVVYPQIQKALSIADAIVAHNGNEFDKPFIKKELQRFGLSMPEKPWIDTMLDGRWATQYGKAPNLGELCWACGVEYNPYEAHSALYDIQVMSQCFFFALRKGFLKLP